MTLRAALAAFLCAAFLSGAAQADVLYVVNSTPSSAAYALGHRWNQEVVSLYLTGLGATLRTVSASQVLTDSLRAGKVQELDGTWTAYDLVVHTLTIGDNYPSNYDPKDLTLLTGAGNGPGWVPQLFINASSGTSNSFISNAACTTGIAGTTGNYSADTVLVAATTKGWHVWQNAGDLRWPVATATRPPGGFRTLIYKGTTVASRAPWGSGAYDSLTAGPKVDGDTLAVWVRQNLNAAQTAPLNIGGRTCAQNIFAWYSYGVRDGDIASLLYAFAYADSLTGGAVFDRSDREPVTFGIGIDDGFKRGEWRGGQTGFAPHQTAEMEVAIDSVRAVLAGATPPAMISLGVDVDSISTYSTDKALWDDLDPYIVYFPHIHSVVSGSPVRRSDARPFDLFANVRAHSMAVGPCNGEAGDTSAVCQMAAALDVMGTAFGASKVDRLLQPAGDRSLMTGTVSTGLGGTMTMDSVSFAIRSAGFTGIRVPANNASTSGQAEAASLTRSWQGNEWRSEYPNGVSGLSPLLTVAHPGYPSVTGGSYSSGSAFANNRWGSRLWNGLFGGWDGGGGYFLGAYPVTSSVPSNPFSPIRMMVFHVSDFCPDAAGNPTMPAYWNIKHALARMSAINEMSGKTLVKCVRPDEIRP